MRIFLIILTLLITGFGCNFSMTDTSTPFANAEFPAVGETAPVTMFIGYNYTGGFGSMPVLNEIGEIRTIALAPVYFDESYQKTVAEKLPSCYVGTPLITVHATVTLEKRREPNTSIPGAPEETYYVAVVKTLDSIDVKTQPCKE